MHILDLTASATNRSSGASTARASRGPSSGSRASRGPGAKGRPSGASTARGPGTKQRQRAALFDHRPTTLPVTRRLEEQEAATWTGATLPSPCTAPAHKILQSWGSPRRYT